MTPPSRSPLIDGFCRGVAPSPELPLREWVSEHVYLPNSPEGARYSLDAVPARDYVFDIELVHATAVDAICSAESVLTVLPEVTTSV